MMDLIPAIIYLILIFLIPVLLLCKWDREE